jgi:Tfp pilus assembly protein PilO
VTRRTALVAFAAAAALLVLWFMFLWGPQGGKLSDAEDREQAADVQNAALELRLSRLRAAQEKAPELMADLEELRRAVPDDPELAQFILDANDAASAAGVDFLSISPGVPSMSDPALPPVISLNIDVRGEYFSVLDYLDRMSELPRVVVVDTLGLTPSESATGQELTVAIVGRMFATSAPQLTTPAPIATPAPTTTTTAPATPEAQQQVTTSTTAPPQITVTTNG